MAIERRKYPRINFDSSIAFQIKGERGINYTLTKDLSEGGMGLLLDKFFPKNSELILEFNLKENTTPIRTKARIVWIEKLPYTERYRAGLEFEEMEPLQKLNIRRFIKKEPLFLYY